VRVWFVGFGAQNEIGRHRGLAGGPRTALLKKNPPLATGRSLGRNGKVNRFGAALCVTIHTRRGKLLGVHRDGPNVPLKNPERRPAKKAQMTCRSEARRARSVICEVAEIAAP